MTKVGKTALWTAAGAAFFLLWGCIWMAIDSPPADDMISDDPVSRIGLITGQIGVALLLLAALLGIAVGIRKLAAGSRL